ncbi:MAG: histidine kinase [Bacteroidetes bacterium]|nr:histidine kinase [Bacteroidota bacterium]
MIKKIFALSFLFFFISLSKGIAQQPVLRNYTVKDGLPNTVVYYAMQDKKGFMWFCTETGLSRFDGHTFENFGLEDGLADIENLKTYEDTKGRIWILSYNGKLCYYLNGKFYNEKNDTTIRHSSDGKFLFDAVEDASGKIWFSDKNGVIFYYNGNQVKPLEKKLSIAGNFLFLKDENGVSLLVKENPKEDGVSLFQTLKMETISPSKPIFNNQIPTLNQTLFVPGKGVIYMRDYQLFIFRNNEVTLLLNTIKDFGFEDWINTVYYDKGTKNLWIGTRDHGVLIIKNFFEGGRDYKQYLNAKVITCIKKDNEGNVWVTTQNDGIFNFPKSQINTVEVDGNDKFFYSIIALSNPTKIIGCNQSGEVYILDSNYKKLTMGSLDKDLNHLNRIMGLQPIAKDIYFLGGSKSSGIIDISTRNINKKFDNISGVKRMSLYGNNLFIASSNHLFKYSNDSLVDLPEGYKFTSLAAINNNELYVGTTTSLLKCFYSQKKFITILNDSITKVPLSDICIVGEEVWVGTHGNGIFILKNDKLILHLTKPNLTSNVCQRLVYYNKKEVWLATNKGISVIDAITKKVKYSVTSNDGLPSDDVKDVAIINNKAFLATSSGICLLQLDKFEAEAMPPNIYITSYTHKDEKAVFPKYIKYLYETGFITITYTGISFLAPSSITYQYKLDGNRWVETHEMQLPLFNLEPGKHKLQIRAKKFNSGWSNPALLTLEVEPRFWQTLWFKIIIVLLVLSIAIIYFRLRIRDIKRRENEKTIINRQIAELESKALANQMNPHFIFNSLNTIQNFILKKDKEQALNYVGNFALLIRQILNNSRNPSISLKDEIDFLERYIRLEQIRFNFSFDCSLDATDNIMEEDVAIPPMLVQPIIENAIKYGIDRREGNLEIQIKISRESDCIIAMVEDNGNGINRDTNPDKKDSAGLQVIKDRLHLMKNKNGSQGSIEITDKKSNAGDGTGTIVTLKIPII